MSDQDAQYAHQEEALQPVSPGVVLARARNSQGLSVAEVAENLKITESYVKAIEESTFDVLPQAAFVRGYIRNYARLVGLSGEDLVKDFDRFIGNDGLDIPRLQGSKKVKPLRAHSTPSPAHAFALLLVVSLGGLSYYLWNNLLDAEPAVEVAIIDEVSEPLPEYLEAAESTESTESTESAESTPLETGSEVEATVAEETAPSDLSVVVEQESEQAEEKPEFPVIAVDSAEIVEVTADDDVNKPALGPGKPLAIDFSQDCWVEIKDSTGEVLVSAVQKAGSSISLDVFPPVSVRFGNTPGVQRIVYDGKPVARPNSSTRVASVLLTGNGQG